MLNLVGLGSVFRVLRILAVGLRFGLHEFVPRLAGNPLVGLLAGGAGMPRAVRLRLALEELGPIFVKFGQVLSTRRDLLPLDIADELAKLQDRVPPFDSDVAAAEIERSLGAKLEDVFSGFERDAVASASIAQVHFAILKDGAEVAVKVLRPGIEAEIAKDVMLLETAASLVERLWPDGRRLKPREVVAEFARHLGDELDLVREAANASQLRRNFEASPLLAIPAIHWDWCTRRVMVMQRMGGTPISQIDALRAQRIDIPALARDGVEIFFTQVFRDGFFHADMHPGNIFVEARPQHGTGAAAADGLRRGRYVALDFGIMGTLNDTDKRYLAQNFLAFFNRDYHRVAQAHLDAGWVPAETRIDEFEAAIRTVCEPIFDRPLKEIFFGRLLLRLFQTSRRFNVEVQPQLVLLQKTLLNIEGLGRQLDPELDLWKTAKPYLERWMGEQVGFRGLMRTLKSEAPYWAGMLPQLPRLLHRALEEDRIGELRRAVDRLAAQNERRNDLLSGLVLILMTVFALIVLPWLL